MSIDIKKVVSIVVSSVVGFALGGFTMNVLDKKKYMKQQERAINEVREYYQEKYKAKEAQIKKEKEEPKKEEKQEEIPFDIPVTGPVKEAAETMMNAYKEANKPYEEDGTYIYQVSPYDVGDFGEYETETLYYRSNGNLYDEQGIVVVPSEMNIGNLLDDKEKEKPNALVSELERTGEIYIRNDRIQIDFEIVRQDEG